MTLTVLLDGKPAYLYRFTQGSYDLKRSYLCAHRERMTPEEARGRFAQAVEKLPIEIAFDYMKEPPEKDLFEQAIELAGFVVVDDEILRGVWLRGTSYPSDERRWLENALEKEFES